MILTKFKSSEKGLTLVELLVSLVITSMIMLSLSTLFTRYLKIIRRTNSTIDILIELRETLDKISKELRQTLPKAQPTGTGVASEVDFIGTSNKLRFNCVRGNSSQEFSNIAEIAYAVNQYTGDFAHWCVQRANRNNQSSTAAPSYLQNAGEKTLKQSPIIDIDIVTPGTDLNEVQGINVTAMALKYYDAVSSTWGTTWDASEGGVKTTLPKKILVNLTATDDKGSNTKKLGILIRPYHYGVNTYY